VRGVNAVSEQWFKYLLGVIRKPSRGRGSNTDGLEASIRLQLAQVDIFE
jgi:hypothetical protein